MDRVHHTVALEAHVPHLAVLAVREAPVDVVPCTQPVRSPVVLPRVADVPASVSVPVLAVPVLDSADRVLAHPV